MSLLRSAQRCNQLLQSSHHINGVRFYQRSILRHLSTAGPEQPLSSAGSEQPLSSAGSEQPPQDESPPIPFLQTPTSSRAVYGRVFGINKHTLKTDIINMLEGSNLTLDNVKVVYNRLFNPVSMLVQFASISDYAAAVRAISRRGRVYRLENVTDGKEWDITKPYNGKYVLIQGLPLNTSPADVHNFLDGYNYDSSSFDLFMRSTNRDPIKMASVRFPTQIEAMNASIRKNRGFLFNNQVVVRVLQ